LSVTDFIDGGKREEGKSACSLNAFLLAEITVPVFAVGHPNFEQRQPRKRYVVLANAASFHECFLCCFWNVLRFYDVCLTLCRQKVADYGLG
jgi:hypothetical protein